MRLLALALALVACKNDDDTVSNGVCLEPSSCSTPSEATLSDDVDLTGETFANLFVDGDRLYRSSWSGGTHVFDLSDPTTPSAMTTLPGGPYTHGHEGVLLNAPTLADATTGDPVGALPESLERVTVRLAAASRIVGLHEPDRTLAWGTLDGTEVKDVVVSNALVALCAGTCVDVLEAVSETHAVVTITGTDVALTALFDLSSDGEPILLDGVFDALAIGPEHLYGSVGNELQVVELATGDAVGTLPDANVPFSLAWGPGALVGTTAGGIQAFDLSDPTAPAPACSFPLDGSLYQRRVHELVWYAARPQGLDVIDLRCAP